MIDEKSLEKTREDIGIRLKQRRIEQGLSQQQLADKCGMTVGTVSRMENGHFWLVMKQFVLVCDALELDYRKIFKA